MQNKRWRTTWRWAGVLIVAGLATPLALGVVYDERNHTFGDDSLEGTITAGVTVLGAGAGNVGPGFTLDSGNPPLPSSDPTGSYIDLEVMGNPLYVDVSSRPGPKAGSLGAQFDGVDDYLFTENGLNAPDQYWDNLLFFDDGGGNTNYPLNYDTIFARAIQAWVKPDGSKQNAVQDIVRDTTEVGGFGISATNNWTLIFDDETRDTGAAVTFDDWTHLQLKTQSGAFGGILYVNGVAVDFSNNFYDPADSPPEELVVGANLAKDDNFYKGQLDDLRLSLWGDNSSVPAGPLGQTGQDYGEFSLATDNDWIAQELSDLGVTNVGDVNLDGTLDTTLDLAAFVAGWGSANLVNGVAVGDWNSRQAADLNWDGVTDLLDWGVYRQALIDDGQAAPPLSAVLASEVPEPASLALLGLGGLMLVRRRR